MCAICGIINYENNNASEQFIRDMCDKMSKRGPDNIGVYLNNNIALGHNRLSIIDVNYGNQPIISNDKLAVIVYNGEIYNFQELRSEIERDFKYNFKTNSDTEVLLAGYQLWGIDNLLNKIEGMYAFCIYDLKTDTIYIVRDRFGEKPLYYVEDNNNFMFASELKAFSPSLRKYNLDKEALNFFMALSYIPSPYTIYKEIRKLEPGHYIRIKGREKDVICYYRLKDNLKEINDDYEVAQEKIRNFVFDSVRTRMISDVPVGAFLSGGIDSSIVCCVMNELTGNSIETFSIGFHEKEYDESKRALIVANHINSKHHNHKLKFDDILNNIDDILDYYDEPFGDSSALPSYYVAYLARKQVKIALTGDAADEIFGGYEKYLIHYYADLYNKIPSFLRSLMSKLVYRCPITSFTSPFIRKAKKLINTANADCFNRYYNMMCMGFNDNNRRFLLKENYVDIKPVIKAVYDDCPCDSILNKEQFCDFRFVLEGDMFPKVDRACMHNSLENRTPFLSRELVEYMFGVNSSYKIKGKNKKRILKDAFKDILPEDTVKFSKRGFGVPIDYWLRNELKSEIISLTDKNFIDKQGIFDYGFVHRLLDEHLNMKSNNRSMLWNIFVFQKWYIKNIS